MPEMPISRHGAGTDIDGGNNWNRMLDGNLVFYRRRSLKTYVFNNFSLSIAEVLQLHYMALHQQKPTSQWRCGSKAIKSLEFWIKAGKNGSHHQWDFANMHLEILTPKVDSQTTTDTYSVLFWYMGRDMLEMIIDYSKMELLIPRYLCE
jgi:hypothetical protein